MKKITTSLTVDGEIVGKARAIIEKTRLPFSVSKLVSTLLFELFDSIERNQTTELPTAVQLRTAIHGKTLHQSAEQPPATESQIEARLAKIESLLAQVTAQKTKRSA